MTLDLTKSLEEQRQQRQMEQEYPPYTPASQVVYAVIWDGNLDTLGRLGRMFHDDMEAKWDVQHGMTLRLYGALVEINQVVVIYGFTNNPMKRVNYQIINIEEFRSNYREVMPR